MTTMTRNVRYIQDEVHWTAERRHLLTPTPTKRGPSQNDRIKGALLTGHKLSALDALRDFGCMRLAARINDLRDEGLQIITEMFKCDGSGRNYACYSVKVTP